MRSAGRAQCASPAARRKTCTSAGAPGSRPPCAGGPNGMLLPGPRRGPRPGTETPLPPGARTAEGGAPPEEIPMSSTPALPETPAPDSRPEHLRLSAAEVHPRQSLAGFALAPDGRRMALVQVRDRRAAEDRQRERVEETPLADVCLLPAGGGYPRPFTSTGDVSQPAAWSPDGRRLLLERDGALRSVPLDGGRRADRLPRGPLPAPARPRRRPPRAGPAGRRTGEWVLLATREAPETTLLLVSADGRTQRRLLTVEGTLVGWDWSPDGRWAAVVVQGEDTSAVDAAPAGRAPGGRPASCGGSPAAPTSSRLRRGRPPRRASPAWCSAPTARAGPSSGRPPSVPSKVADSESQAGQEAQEGQAGRTGLRGAAPHHRRVGRLRLPLLAGRRAGGLRLPRRPGRAAGTTCGRCPSAAAHPPASPTRAGSTSPTAGRRTAGWSTGTPAPRSRATCGRSSPARRRRADGRADVERPGGGWSASCARPTRSS